MNYYEHHIGDYDKNTSHLTACEDGIYSRMIRRYMDKERPLDVDPKEIKRIVRARNREEKSAVDTILKEFFQLESDGWHHKTCDETIAAYQAGEPEREIKKVNEDNRLKRHREERARLFKLLTDAGQHAPWNIGMTELRELVSRLPETPTVTQPVTAPATPVTATQSPITNHQSPELKEEAVGDSTEVGAPDDDRLPPRPQHTQIEPGMRAIAIATLLTGAGVKKVTAFHPDVAVTWAQDERVTDVLLLAAVARAKETLGDQSFQVTYLRPIVVELLNPREQKKPKSDDWAWKRSNQGIEAKGRELSMFARGGESYPDFAARIQAAIDKRKGA